MPAPATNQSEDEQARFSHAVKVRLLERKLSVSALARELGIDRNTVSRAIHHRLFRPTQLRIAKKLNLTPPNP